jgi:single-strand DNA-binding protein
MNETEVTFQGYLGNEVEERIVGDGATVATFRVGSTPRRFNKKENSWVDGETSWYTVNAWRALGRHCLASLSTGDPVVVHGRLQAQVWTDAEGHAHQTMVVDAISVGHDLARGTSAFVKAVPGLGHVDDSAVRELNAQLGVGGPQMTSDGQVLDQEPAA